MVSGEDDTELVDQNFYGVLDEVLDFQYAERRRVFFFFFKCTWFDTYSRRNSRTHMDLGYKIHLIHLTFVMLMNHSLLLSKHNKFFI